MTYVIDRDGIAACPDDPLRVSTEEIDFDLCPQLIWHGLALAVLNERPFMGKSHEWWQNMILDTVYEHCEHLVDTETLREYEA